VFHIVERPDQTELMNFPIRRPMRGEARIRIAAPPEVVWDLVADVPRMGEWSPECRRCDWLAGATGPTVGARFKGHSRIGPWRWSREVLVTAADRGREFAFVTLGSGGAEQTRWRYRFAALDQGTEVEESFEGVTRPLYLHVMFAIPRSAHLRERQAERGMRRTLDRLKAAAEKRVSAD
jgi:hypothetical protein